VSFFKELERRNVIRAAMAYVVAAWLIIQVVETIFPAFGFGDTAVRLVVIVLAIGLIPTLVFSWAFEITREGFKREVDVEREESIARFTGKRLDRFIMVALALALGYFAFDKFVLEPTRDAALVEEVVQQVRSEALVDSYGDKSIAVLPFVNMSDDASNEYFSDGISEELLNLLAKIPELRVISRSSAFSYKGRNLSIPTVAEQLNVGHVLEGSVRKAGNRVRITAQLIEAKSDTHLWSESYDRELDDIFAVQDEIASAIGDALKLSLAVEPGATLRPTAIKTGSASAYDAYLRGRELIHRRTNEDLAAAHDHLRRSLRLDDSFAPAHAQLAIAMMLGPKGSLESVISHLDRAQELEPDLAEAHGGRALLELQTTRDPVATIEHARKALASNPNYVDALNWLQVALDIRGHYRESDETLERILLIDPLSVIGSYNYAMRLAEQGRIPEAHDVADRMLASSPRMGYAAHADIALFYEGKITEGLRWGLRSGPDNIYIIWAFAYVGEYDEARRINEEFNYWADLAQGRYDALAQQWQMLSESPPIDEGMVVRLAEALYKAGRVGDALPLLERARGFAYKGQIFFDPYPNHKMMWLAQARRHTGDEEGAQAAAQIARQDLAARRAAGRNNHALDQVEALLAGFEHDLETVTGALESAIERGMRDRQIFRDPIFADFRDEPRFARLQEELQSVLDKEHARVQQLICFDNPVPDEWQPLQETCERVERP